MDSRKVPFQAGQTKKLDKGSRSNSTEDLAVLYNYFVSMPFTDVDSEGIKVRNRFNRQIIFIITTPIRTMRWDTRARQIIIMESKRVWPQLKVQGICHNRTTTLKNCPCLVLSIHLIQRGQVPRLQKEVPLRFLLDELPLLLKKSHPVGVTLKVSL